MTERIAVRKTPKLFIGGAFVRSESGRTYKDAGGDDANVAFASRKDARDAVKAARGALAAWSGKTGYNRGQILYRLAEMMESRPSSFGVARAELQRSVDHVVWYAGWCDKIEQFLSTKNPVAGPHFNVSSPEPTGVVAAIAPQRARLRGLIEAVVPALAGGNTVVAVAAPIAWKQAIALAEAVATCDLTPGALNLLTGDREPLALQLAKHMDVNAISYWSDDDDRAAAIRREAVDNVKRVEIRAEKSRGGDRTDAQDPWRIAAFMEIKTVWHPAGM